MVTSNRRVLLVVSLVHGLSVTIGLVQGDFHHVSCTWTIGYVPGLFSWTMDDVWVRVCQVVLGVLPGMFEIPLVSSILVWSTTYRQSHKTNWSPCKPPTLRKESFGQRCCFCIIKIVVKLMPTADWQHSNVIDWYVWANTPAWTILWCVVH